MRFTLEPFRLLAADYSLRRSGFAILDVNPLEQTIAIKELYCVNNRSKAWTNAEMLRRIYDATYTLARDSDVYVREFGQFYRIRCIETQHEVSGVAQLALWESVRASFIDIPATQVKKEMTGNERASKKEVEDTLALYVGRQEYACDDMSDAVALGIAWLKTVDVLDTTDGGFRINHAYSCRQSFGMLDSALHQV